MKKGQDALVQCFLFEMQELSKKYNLWLDGDDMMVINDKNHIITRKVELDDDGYKTL